MGGHAVMKSWTFFFVCFGNKGGISKLDLIFYLFWFGKRALLLYFTNDTQKALGG